MKLKISKSIYGVALVTAFALALMLLLAVGQGAQAEKVDGQGKSDSKARKLEGTWRTQVTIRDCQTGEVVRTFLALVTFARGGTLNATTTGSSPARVSPDYGIWRHTGRHTYSAVSEAFLFGPTGDWIGTQRVTRTIEIGEDLDELNATASTEFFAPDGNPIPGFPPSPVCSTAVGRRME